MTKQRMIGNLEFKNGKVIDNGQTVMTKREMKIFDDHDRRQKAGKNVSYSFEPMNIMDKLTLHVDKDRRGNVTVFVRQPKKGECHHHKCYRKTVKDYVLCRKHLRKKK